MQHYGMTALMVSKRGTITLPPDLRRKLGLDRLEQPMVLVEEREGGIFLQTAAPIPVREFSKGQIEQWIKDDEEGHQKFNARKR
jgi:bifunctional DNA-binding transcriptional regulator/antitoxin component of YhaV-PrlF toxin-antitoxin module